MTDEKPTCINCGRPIDAETLKKNPTAGYCKDCQAGSFDGPDLIDADDLEY